MTQHTPRGQPQEDISWTIFQEAVCCCFPGVNTGPEVSET